jgi:hypothetical protein
MLSFRMLHRSRLAMLSAFAFASARSFCRKYRIGWLPDIDEGWEPRNGHSRSPE